MAASTAAQQAEKKAFDHVSQLLGRPEVFAEPAGFETAFPDFGFRIYVDKKPVDIHIEYKADAKAQMGSMRDWVFDGSRFSTTDSGNENKRDLIDLMNKSPEALKNAKRLLDDLKKYFDSRVTKLYSGSLTLVTDKKERRAKILSFRDNVENYQIAKIDNAQLGAQVITHYKNKFAKSIRRDAAYNVLLMMIGNVIWFVDDQGTADTALKKAVAERFGISSWSVMTALKAQLEVRIQPRGLSNPDKPVSIDVMASFRLSGKPTGGSNI